MKRTHSFYHWRTCCVLVLLIILTACEKWDLEQESFPEAITLHFETGRQLTEGVLYGEITGLQENDLTEECGHLWSLSSDSLLPGISFGQSRRGKRGNGAFQSPVSGLRPGTTYYYRAYVRDKNQQISYGEVSAFGTSSFSPVLTIDSIISQPGTFRVKIYTTISNLMESGLPVSLSSFGVTWSGQPFPDIHADPYFPQQGITVTEEPEPSLSFPTEATLPGNENYLRPYLSVGGETYYGENRYYFVDNIWAQKADFGGGGRQLAVGFSIGQKGYIGTGEVDGQERKDFWEYDPQSDSWAQKADFGGGVRLFAVGFSIGQKGYIGTGTDVDYQSRKDFWEYDPQSDSWAQRADFGGGERDGAVGFSIGQKGYIGTGYYGLYCKRDFWEYDPQSDSWAQRADFGGGERGFAVGFSIGQKGYIGTGTDLDYQSRKDFWEYGPQSDSWIQKADFSGVERELAVGFSIGQKGYIGTGWDEKELRQKDFWEYNPQNDSWAQKVDFGGGERSSAVGFSIGQKGYIGAGWDLDYQTRKDFWEYIPE